MRDVQAQIARRELRRSRRKGAPKGPLFHPVQLRLQEREEEKEARLRDAWWHLEVTMERGNQRHAALVRRMIASLME